MRGKTSQAQAHAPHVGQLPNPMLSVNSIIVHRSLIEIVSNLWGIQFVNISSFNLDVLLSLTVSTARFCRAYVTNEPLRYGIKSPLPCRYSYGMDFYLERLR
jgi:hypothetical protein